LSSPISLPRSLWIYMDIPLLTALGTHAREPKFALSTHLKCALSAANL
jgi:hypothetical protein